MRSLCGPFAPLYSITILLRMPLASQGIALMNTHTLNQETMGNDGQRWARTGSPEDCRQCSPAALHQAPLQKCPLSAHCLSPLACRTCSTSSRGSTHRFAIPLLVYKLCVLENPPTELIIVTSGLSDIIRRLCILLSNVITEHQRPLPAPGQHLPHPH